LSIESAADRAAFLSTFGEAVTYTPQGGQPRSIDMIFDGPQRVQNVQTGEIEMTAPEGLCDTGDVSGVKHRDTIERQSVTYYVIGIEHDGTGMTTLILSKD